MNKEMLDSNEKDNFFDLLSKIDTILLDSSKDEVRFIEVKQELKEKADDTENNYDGEMDSSPILFDDKAKDFLPEAEIDFSMDDFTSADAWISEGENSKIFNKLESLYPEFGVEINSVYFKSEDVSTENLIDKIQNKLHSLKDIIIGNIKTLYLPFCFYKILMDRLFSISLEINQVTVPISFNYAIDNLRFNAVSSHPPEEKMEHWITLLNQTQLDLIGIIRARGINKSNTTTSPESEQADINFDIVKGTLDSILEKESESFQIDEILDKIFVSLQERFDSKKLWETNEQYNLAKPVILNQIEKLEKNLNVKNRTIQKNYTQLKNTQEKLENVTKKYKLLDSKGIKIERGEKEKLASSFTSFQKEKNSLQSQINELKLHRQVLDQWKEIIHAENLELVNSLIFQYFQNNIKEQLQLLQNIKEKEDPTTFISKQRQNNLLKLHLIWFPVKFIDFSAQQLNEDLKGRALFFDTIDKMNLLKPALI